MAVALKIPVLQELLDGFTLVHLVGCKGVSSPEESEHGTGGEFSVVGGPNHGWRVSCVLVGVVNIGGTCRFELSEVQTSGLEGPSWCSGSARES